jgi:DNA-binding response OmpR family regulator
MLPSPPVPEPRRILLVEDEPLIAFSLEDLVQELGFAVVGPAYRLSEGFALLEEEQIDAAILDVNLNEERSYPLADLLAEQGVPFLFATGYAEGGVEWSGSARVIAKPYTRDQVSRALRDLLG